MRRPLSERSKATSTWEGPYEDVPGWMVQPLADWIATVVITPAYRMGSEDENRVRIQLLQQTLRLELDWRRGVDGAWSDLCSRAFEDEELFLDLADQALTYVDEPGQLDHLQGILNSSGSVWTIGHGADGNPELQQRVDSTVTAAVQASAPSGTIPAIHLTNAWSRIYGRDPSPSEGYREAVRAVEAAAAPIVSRMNPAPTLGTMLADLKETREVGDGPQSTDSSQRRGRDHRHDRTLVEGAARSSWERNRGYATSCIST